MFENPIDLLMPLFPFLILLILVGIQWRGNRRLQKENRRLRTALTEAETRIEMNDASEARFEKLLEGLAATALKENQESFFAMARRTFEAYLGSARQEMGDREKKLASQLKPLSEAVTRYDEQVRAFEKERERAYGDLARQLASLSSAQQALSNETGRLVTALKQPHTRGRWGETTLRRVAEMAGMTARCDFFEQVSIDTEDGRIRPDMVIALPGGKSVVVDAKVSLSAYLQAVEADTPERRRNRLETHAAQLMEHGRQLASKKYWQAFASPEFVVMFIPGENFFGAALSHQPDLIERLAERSVIPATPTTLIALLKTVSLIWREQESRDNAREIATLGKELHHRLLVFAEHFEKMGKDITKLTADYNRSVGSFSRRVMPATRKFSELGIPLPENRKVSPPAEIEDFPETAPLSAWDNPTTHPESPQPEKGVPHV